MDYKIDLVVPYVDSTDKNWQEVFKKFSPKTVTQSVNGQNRFRGQGNFFRYFFRCIATNMSWINRIFLIVQSQSQVPNWIDRKQVTIVTHDQFIPAEFLPIFSSCAIEMFLHKIPELSEHFIYTNDDTFVTNKVTPEDFYLDDKARFEVLRQTIDVNKKDMYMTHCKNCHNLIFNQDTSNIIRLDHGLKPYLKSKMEECFNLFKTNILGSISKFRQQNNYNCYLYSLYLYKIGMWAKSNLKLCYTTASGARTIGLNIKTNHIVCLNDSEADCAYTNDKINEAFATRFSNTSKYETSKYTYKAKPKRTAYLYF